MNTPCFNENKKLKLEYKYKINTGEDEDEYLKLENNEKGDQDEGEEEDEDDSFTFSQEITQIITNPNLDIKNIKKYPYNIIGTLVVKFPFSNEEFAYTCFAIYRNVVITLANNLYNKEKGGMAVSISVIFLERIDNWEKVIFQENDNQDIQNKNDISKLAAILYNDNIFEEWVGLEGGNEKDFEGRDIYAVFSLGYLSNKALLREIYVITNPFLEAKNQKVKKKKIF